MEIPDNATTRWLFADELSEKGNILEFVEMILDYKSKNNKPMPVFVFLGETEKFKGELICTTWNISNLKELKQTIGSDSSKWTNRKFLATKDKLKINLKPL